MTATQLDSSQHNDLRRRLREDQAILDNATIGILFTRHKVYQRVNRHAAEMFGYTVDELVGQPTRILLPSADDYRALTAQVAPLLREGKPFSGECWMQKRNGEQIRIRLSANHVEPGNPALGTLWIAEDITAQREAQLALQRAMQESEAILNTVVMGVALLRHRTIERCNRRMEELFGFAEGTMQGCSTRVWYGDDETWDFVGKDVYADLAAGREAFREQWFQRQDGTPFWGRLAGRAFDPADPYAGSVWIIEDLTRERAEREELLLARKVFEVNSEAIMVSDASNRIVRVNAAFEAITGYRESEVLGNDPKILGSGRHGSEFFRSLWQELMHKGHWEGEIWDRRKDGCEYPKWVHIDTIRDGDGHISHYVAVFSDISERKASEERIRYLAQHDALTGLPNRFTLAVHLEHALARAERSGEQIGLMFIDLDNFKTINDTLGHHIGDLVLCEVARRITAAVRKSDIVARIGGDEFVVVLESGKMPGDAGTVAQKIIDRLSDPIPVDGNDLHTTPSIGIGIYPEDGHTIDVLMKNADVAMYHAKSAGRNNFQFYAEHMNTAAAIRMQMESRLRAAMQNDEFSLHFQPQVALPDGRIAGCEALIRWQNAELGSVSPNSFIPLAEEIGLIVPLGEWVLRTACRTAKAWLDAGIEFGVMAVNISPQQFRQRNFPQRVELILAETGLPPQYLELEITESTIMETAEVAVAMLMRLKNLGLSLSVDDFGTGYSSLAYLKRFPIERLKIDRSFISDLENDPSDAAIATAVIALAHSLALKVVAEGVETQWQSDFLQGLGCDSVQGYFYSRPAPADAAAEFCRQRGSIRR